MRPYMVVLDIDRPAPEPFAVIAVDPTQRHPDGGCMATVMSLHMTRAEAERAAASDGSAPQP